MPLSSCLHRGANDSRTQDQEPSHGKLRSPYTHARDRSSDVLWSTLELMSSHAAPRVGEPS